MALRHVRHLPAQLPVVAALGQTLIARRRASPPTGELVATVAPPHPALVRDYVEHVGGDAAAYRAMLPPHLFPQWSFPLAARTLRGLPYPLTRIVNAGCSLSKQAPLPAGEPLLVRASLTSIDDDGRRAILTQRVVTGTARDADALVATITTVVPLRPARSAGKASDTAATRSTRSGRDANNGTAAHSASPKQAASIPYDAHELARWSLARDAGLAFAVLTGDFNPIHWLSRAGIAAGFGGPILHGFAMFARAIEGVTRARFAGNPSHVRTWSAKFTRPLRLPADVALFARGEDIWIGDAPGTAPYLAMTLATTEGTDTTFTTDVSGHRSGTDATSATQAGDPS
ncbi:MAG TPA: MaoC/PaaZ C-terminal domain-containing protein [Kofleriaceae bacterium]|nr:MaoC/PaaZ C-terminal domain-containing protein [Kofleriaceae bacterium]